MDKGILADLDFFIRPLGKEKNPVLSNFFAEFKHMKTDILAASRQARYAGAIGARAIHKLYSFSAERAYDNKAYTIAAIFHEGDLRLYAHHPISRGLLVALQNTI